MTGKKKASRFHQKKRAKKSITRVNFQTSDKDLVVHRCGAYSFSCTVCSRRVSCQYQGVRDEKEHISSKIHQTLAKEALSQPKLSFPSVDPLTLKVMTDVTSANDFFQRLLERK